MLAIFCFVTSFEFCMFTWFFDEDMIYVNGLKRFLTGFSSLLERIK